MIQNITIEVPEGKKAIYNEKTNSIEFVDAEPVRSKSWEEFCNNHQISKTTEFYIDNNGNVKSGYIAGRYNKNWLETREDAEAILSFIQLTRLHDEWVGTWRPKQLNDEVNYIITSFDRGVSVQYNYNTYRFLSFPTEKMASEFLECFYDLIYKAKKFI